MRGIWCPSKNPIRSQFNNESLRSRYTTRKETFVYSQDPILRPFPFSCFHFPYSPRSQVTTERYSTPDVVSQREGVGGLRNFNPPLVSVVLNFRHQVVRGLFRLPNHLSSLTFVCSSDSKTLDFLLTRFCWSKSRSSVSSSH